MGAPADDIEIPQWDIALAGLAREEHGKIGTPLILKDFRHLAEHFTIRFDDIMTTMFQLVIHGEWNYTNADGKAQRFEQSELDDLFVNGRLNESDLQRYNGTWSPNY